MKAAELTEEDLLRTNDRELVSVQALGYNTLEESVTVYNFEVADFHTYYAGEVSVLVHNVDYRPTEPVPGVKGAAAVVAKAGITMAGGAVGGYAGKQIAL